MVTIERVGEVRRGHSGDRSTIAATYKRSDRRSVTAGWLAMLEAMLQGELTGQAITWGGRASVALGLLNDGAKFEVRAHASGPVAARLWGDDGGG